VTESEQSKPGSPPPPYSQTEGRPASPSAQETSQPTSPLQREERLLPPASEAPQEETVVPAPSDAGNAVGTTDVKPKSFPARAWNRVREIPKIKKALVAAYNEAITRYEHEIRFNNKKTTAMAAGVGDAVRSLAYESSKVDAVVTAYDAGKARYKDRIRNGTGRTTAMAVGGLKAVDRVARGVLSAVGEASNTMTMKGYEKGQSDKLKSVERDLSAGKFSPDERKLLESALLHASKTSSSSSGKSDLRPLKIAPKDEYLPIAEKFMNREKAMKSAYANPYARSGANPYPTLMRSRQAQSPFFGARG